MKLLEIFKNYIKLDKFKQIFLLGDKERDISVVRSYAFFDEEWYLQQNPDE